MTKFEYRNNPLTLIVIVLATFIQIPSKANGQTLSEDSPERKQLIAMGYEIDAEDENDGFTVARLGSTSITFTKSNEKLTVMRLFSRKENITSDEKNELYEQVNRINNDLTYQTVILEDSIVFALYDFGDYTPKAFAKMVRLAERVNSVFDAYPRLLELIKNK